MTDAEREELEALGIDEFYEPFSREMDAVMKKIFKQIDEDAVTDFRFPKEPAK